MHDDERKAESAESELEAKGVGEGVGSHERHVRALILVRESGGLSHGNAIAEENECRELLKLATVEDLATILESAKRIERQRHPMMIGTVDGAPVVASPASISDEEAAW